MLKLKKKYIGFKIVKGVSIIELTNNMTQKELLKLDSKFVSVVKNKEVEDDKDTEESDK